MQNIASFSSESDLIKSEKTKILYVDDEKINLSNFSLVFEDEYEILTASDGDEALILFRDEKDISIVIADQRMPGMSGVEFLEKIRAIDPGSIRIILTGYSDSNDLINAINRGYVYQYILKPWRQEPLRITLHRAQETHRLQKENALLSRRLLHVAEEEQKRIAMDLHDEFGQVLPTLRHSIEKIRKSLPEIPPDLQDAFDTANKLIERIGDISRETASVLRPDILDRMGLVETINWGIREFKNRHPNIEIEFEVIGTGKKIPPEIETTLFRVFQEAFNNINKHTEATKVEVALTYMHPQIILAIHDNGCGFEPNKPMTDQTIGAGVGLKGMRERVVSVNGILIIRSKLGMGTIIRAELPLEQG